MLPALSWAFSTRLCWVPLAYLVASHVFVNGAAVEPVVTVPSTSRSTLAIPPLPPDTALITGTEPPAFGPVGDVIVMLGGGATGAAVTVSATVAIAFGQPGAVAEMVMFRVPVDALADAFTMRVASSPV